MKDYNDKYFCKDRNTIQNRALTHKLLLETISIAKSVADNILLLTDADYEYYFERNNDNEFANLDYTHFIGYLTLEPNFSNAQSLESVVRSIRDFINFGEQINLFLNSINVDIHNSEVDEVHFLFKFGQKAALISKYSDELRIFEKQYQGDSFSTEFWELSVLKLGDNSHMYTTLNEPKLNKLYEKVYSQRESIIQSIISYHEEVKFGLIRKFRDELNIATVPHVDINESMNKTKSHITEEKQFKKNDIESAFTKENCFTHREATAGHESFTEPDFFVLDYYLGPMAINSTLLMPFEQHYSIDNLKQLQASAAPIIQYYPKDIVFSRKAVESAQAFSMKRKINFYWAIYANGVWFHIDNSVIIKYSKYFSNQVLSCEHYLGNISSEVMNSNKTDYELIKVPFAELQNYIFEESRNNITGIQNF